MRDGGKSCALRVLFAGGGTGGHLMPGAATAGALRALVSGARSLFLLTDRRVESWCLGALEGFETIQAPDLRWEGTARAPRLVARGLLACGRMVGLMRRFRPHVVVGLGGVNSVVPVLVARALGARTALFESNVLPGRAVRMLAPAADCTMLHWPQAAARLRARCVRLTGNPVRPGLFGADREAARRRLGLQPGRPTLLAMGGSQGAQALNEALFGALERLRAREGARPQVLHLTGPDLLRPARERAEQLGLTGYRPIGFLERMEDAYAVADLALGRAGGASLAELTALGLPAILVPYPHSTDAHQLANARAMAAAGAALTMEQSDLSPETLADAIAALTADGARRGRMAACARRIGRPGAALEVAAELAAMARFAPHTLPSRLTPHRSGDQPLQAA